MKKYAVIDIGSNSTHMDIFEVDDNNIMFQLEYKTTINKLGQFISQKHIPDKNILELLDILKDYIKYAKSLNINDIFIFATSILREIEQKEQVLEKIEKHVGYKLDILSEEQETMLAYKGVTECYDLTDKKSIIIDIGGGSTEIIASTDYIVDFSKSFPIGLAKTKEKFDISKDFDFDTKYHLEDECNQLIDSMLEKIPNVCFDIIIGTSSLFKTIGFSIYENISNLAGLKDRSISITDFNNIINLLIAGEEVAIPEDRQDIVLIGAIFMKIFLEKTKCDSVLIAPCSIREAYLRDRI